jgi:hypothetical protein
MAARTLNSRSWALAVPGRGGSATSGWPRACPGSRRPRHRFIRSVRRRQDGPGPPGAPDLPKSGSRGRRGPARGPMGASPRGLGPAGWLPVGLLNMGEAPGVGGLVSTVTPLAASATVTSKQGGSHSFQYCGGGPQSGAQAREQQQKHCGNTIPGSTSLIAFVSDVAHSAALAARMRRITRRGIPRRRTFRGR